MDPVEQTFAALRGRPAWQVEWEPALGLKLSFGPPRMTVREPCPTAPTTAAPLSQRVAARRIITVKGTWWLWVWCGRWSLETDAAASRVSASSSAARRRTALRYLDGQRLLQAAIDAHTGRTTLTFDLGATLRLWGSVADDGVIYSLYKPGGYVLHVRTDGAFSHERAGCDHRWRTRTAT